MIDKQAPLLPDATYHIYNRANGSEQLFVSDENYRFFLNRYHQYIHPIAHTLCYCLMPNHFHFLIRIRGYDELRALNLTGFGNLSGLDPGNLLSKQWSNFLNSYSKAFNKQQNRKGSLFIRPTKRVRVQDEKYLRKLVHYIHWNPVLAGLAMDLSGWPFSSYRAIVSRKPTAIFKTEVIELFESVDNFIYCHVTEPTLSGIE